MHMIQAKKLAHYEEDKTITKLKQSLQKYSEQRYTVHATLPHVLALNKWYASQITLSGNEL